MARSAPSEAPSLLPMRQRLVNARLLTLLKLTRISGELAYGREVGATLMHRRLITLIGNFGGLSSAELVQLTGSDKAQISRAVKALTEAGCLERASLRSRIALTADGEALFDRIMAVARKRDRAVARGIGKAELSRFTALTSQLAHRAAQLLALERQRSREQGDDSADAGPESFVDQLGENRRRPLSRMILPSILALVSYLQRSGTVAYKRETGISQFEWQILSQVAEHAPITLADLITLTASDKSHIGRTLRRLTEAGLVLQRRATGRRETVLTTTGKGAEIYDRMCTIAVRRDDYLFDELPAEVRQDYVATIDQLTANAEAMVEEESRRGDGTRRRSRS